MRIALITLFLVAMPVAAIDLDRCQGPVTHLTTLYELRSLMMRPGATSYDVGRFIDARIDEFRQPLPEGGYRWVRWLRPTGDGPVEKRGHLVRAVRGSGDPDRVEASASRAYAVRVVVPRKRSLLKENNPVYAGTVVITYEMDGRTRTREERIEAWMNPDTSRTFDLQGIAGRVHAAVDASTARNNTGESLVELHLREAVSDDDPANPNYSTVQMLKRLRGSATAAAVDAEVAAYERTLFPGAQPFPLLTLLADLRRADDLMRSEKPEEKEKGQTLLRETLRRLR